MTWPQITSWAFLLLGALMISALLQQNTRPAPAEHEVAAVRLAPAIPQPAVLTTPSPPVGLIVPVAGVGVLQLADTWGASRSEGRTHEGIDIMAPAGTRVLAAANGRIVKFFDSERGGITIYQFDSADRFVFYYAHLQARAPGLSEGAVVRQGDLLGFVGMTDNAPVPHLHFEIQRLTDERRWWVAEAVNPYPYLRDGRAP
ncbi:MAG: M23 family metallopeptidase [Hyphomonadaceae bacterium]